MKNSHIKKIISLIIFSCIIYSIPGTITINQSEHITNEKYFNKPKLSPDRIEIPVNYVNEEQDQLLNNYPFFNQVNEHIFQNDLLNNRPSSIISTYYATLSLKNLDPMKLAQKSELIKDYLYSKYNPETKHFEDNVNYSYFHEYYNEGRELILTPYSYEITHQMALIALAEIGKLSELFNTLTIDDFSDEIKYSQNNDYGFGTINAPNSTLLETYFSCYALMAINDFSSSVLSPTQIQQIQFFVENQQYDQSNPFVPGAFKEYHEELYFGWEYFYSSWLALKTIDIINGDFDNVRIAFIGFLKDNGIYNSQTLCFFGEYNDRAHSEVSTYFGSAIIGECVRVLDSENEFENISIVKSTLLNANNGEFFFYKSNRIKTEDPFVQYIIVNYLENCGLIDSIENIDGISDYISTYFSGSGGASFVSNKYFTAESDYYRDVFNSTFNENFNPTVEYEKIMSRYDYDEGKFYASTGYLDFWQTYKDKIIKYWNCPCKNPIESTYYSVKLLARYNLLDEFYSEVAMDYLDCEGWVADYLNPNGYFKGSKYEENHNYLQLTYQALEFQNILIEFDTGQTFGYYYSEENISTILDYTNQFITETPELWFAENNGQDKFASTLEVIRINEILNNSQIVNNQKLERFIENSFDNFENLEITEKNNLLELVKYHFGNSPQDFIKNIMDNNQIKSMCNDLINHEILRIPQLKYINLVENLDYLMVFINIPPNQEIGKKYDYYVQIASLTSLQSQSLENLIIYSDRMVVDTYETIGNSLKFSVVPELAENPYLWLPKLRFDWKGRNYESNLSIPIAINWESEIILNTNIESEIVSAEIVLYTYELVYLGLNPTVMIFDKNNSEIANFESTNLNITQEGNSIKFGFEVPFEILQNNTNYSFKCDFEKDWAQTLDFNYNFVYANNSYSTNTTTESTETTETTNENNSESNSNSTTISENTGSTTFNSNRDKKTTNIIFTVANIGIGAIAGVSVFIFKKKKKLI